MITVTVPAATSDVITITDTMSAGLDFKDPDSIAVTDGYGKGTKATVNGRSFTIVLDKNTGAAATSTITFTAVVNKDAIVDTGKKNEVKIEYGNYHNEDTVYYDIYRAGAFKYDGANGTELKGVKFTLKDGANELKVKYADGYYYVSNDKDASSTVTTDDKGFILIRGLDNVGNTYTLTETETLTGYNLLSAPVTLKLTKDEMKDQDGNLVTYTYQPSVDRNDKIPLAEQTTFVELVTIENNTGSLLPSTGGIGTTIFYIIGGILIVAGVAYFIVRRKTSVE
jgi:fimbrial isopeptide formation D2 family protein/LPXTG-motif cell wall-anchored protein